MVSKRTLLEHSREAWRWPIPKHFEDPSGYPVGLLGRE